MKTLGVALLACSLSACIYTGSARGLTPATLQQERGWIAVQGLQPVSQHAEHDCGPAALQMVLTYWHKPVAGLDELRVGDARISAAALRDHARATGLLAYVMEGSFEDILYELKHDRPVIVGVAKPTAQGAVAHYEVVIGVHPPTRRIATLDPSAGWRQNSLEGFLKEWLPTGSVLIVVMPPSAKDAASPPQDPAETATPPATATPSSS